MVIHQKRKAVLQHIARYGVTLRSTLHRVLYSDGGNCESDLKSLREEDLLAVVTNAVPEPLDPRTKYSYYQLTRKACDLVGAPASRARKLGGFALRRHLAILWFCCLRQRRAHRLHDAELSKIFAIPERPESEDRIGRFLSGYHCLVLGQHHQIHNMYATEANDRDTLSELKKRVEDAHRIAAVAEAIRSKQYVFTLLVETEARRDELRNEIAKQCGQDGFVFHVVRSPGSWRGERSRND